MEKGVYRWEPSQGTPPPAEDHSKWGASQIEAGHLYEAGSPQVGHVKIVKGILHE